MQKIFRPFLMGILVLAGLVIILNPSFKEGLATPLQTFEASLKVKTFESFKEKLEAYYPVSIGLALEFKCDPTKNTATKDICAAVKNLMEKKTGAVAAMFALVKDKDGTVAAGKYNKFKSQIVELYTIANGDVYTIVNKKITKKSNSYADFKKQIENAIEDISEAALGTSTSSGSGAGSESDSDSTSAAWALVADASKSAASGTTDSYELQRMSRTELSDNIFKLLKTLKVSATDTEKFRDLLKNYKTTDTFYLRLLAKLENSDKVKGKYGFLKALKAALDAKIGAPRSSSDDSTLDWPYDPEDSRFGGDYRPYDRYRGERSSYYADAAYRRRRIAALRNAGTRNAGYDYNPETDEADVSSSYVAPAGNTVIIGRGYAPRVDEDEYDYEYEDEDYYGPKEEDEESTTYLLERPARKRETRWPTPLGEQDMYMLKTQIVPPVCPACPSLTCNSNTLGQSKYKESKDKDSKNKDKGKDKYKNNRDSRKQKKYNSEDEDEDDENVQRKNMSMSLPQPLLANFSSFGR